MINKIELTYKNNKINGILIYYKNNPIPEDVGFYLYCLGLIWKVLKMSYFKELEPKTIKVQISTLDGIRYRYITVTLLKSEIQNFIDICNIKGIEYSII